MYNKFSILVEKWPKHIIANYIIIKNAIFDTSKKCLGSCPSASQNRSMGLSPKSNYRFFFSFLVLALGKPWEVKLELALFFAIYCYLRTLCLGIRTKQVWVNLLDQVSLISLVLRKFTYLVIKEISQSQTCQHILMLFFGYSDMQSDMSPKI